MKQLIIFITLIMLMTTAKTKSAEIIPVWNRTIEGKVQDMEFLKGQNEILMLVGEGSNGQIQRRNPENGELIHSFPYPLSTGSKFVLTPDSLRFVLLNGNGGLVRNLDEQYTISSFFDIEYEDTIGIKYSIIAMDPVRPYVYVASTGWFKKTNFPAPRNKVIVYNYETGEHIKDLTEYGGDEYTAIEVSYDGKYLATLNNNKAYLKVWDLESIELIINEALFDENSSKKCEAEDIYFSKINPDIIYYSGLFTKKINSQDIYPPSIYTYSLSKKEQKLILPNDIYGGWNMIFLDNETRIISSTYNTLGIINQNLNSLEWYNIPPDNVYTAHLRYSNNGNFFIGASSNELSKFLYDRETSTVSEYEEEIIISPNPTNSFVNIELNCVEPLASYQINDINGLLIYQSTIQSSIGGLQIDFTAYPIGAYLLTINCDNQLKTYKIVKEG